MLPDDVKRAVEAEAPPCPVWLSDASHAWAAGWNMHRDSVRAHLEAQEAALQAARQVIALDRQSLFDCHCSPVSRKVEDAPGLAGLAEYDEVLAKIDAVSPDLQEQEKDA